MSVKKLFNGDFLKFITKYKYVIIVAVVGLLLISFPTGKREESPASSNGELSDFSLEEFEKRVENVLRSCNGVGRAEVMLSIKSGAERVYAQEESYSTGRQERGESSDESEDSDKKPSILSVGSGKEEPVLIKQVYPKFRGAVIVCDGAENIKVCSEVTAAVASLTGLTVDKISVIKMKN